MKKCFLFIFLSLALFGVEYDIKSLKTKENSLAKDYYIYRLLEKNSLDKKELKALRTHIFRYVGKIKLEFEKIIPPKIYTNKAYAPCYKYTKDNILDANSSCQSVRLNSIFFISTLSDKTRSVMAENFKENKALYNLLLAFNSKNEIDFLAQKEDVNGFFRLLQYSKKYDLDLNASFVNKLASHKEFKNFVKNIVIKKENPKFQKSLLGLDKNLAKDETAFYLGVNALKFGEEGLASGFFKKAEQSFVSQNDKDNALFWVWLINKNENDLKNLAKSSAINIYSLYAKELTNAKFPELEKVAVSKKEVAFNMQDPFAWQSLNEKIKKSSKAELDTLLKEFDSEQTLPIYAFLLERKNDFKKHYFIMPYFEYLKDYDTNRQALILALARQESRFIPSAISTSYALGMMQFMPFLANHIGKKELKIPNFDQDFMFEPKVAYYFANYHLDYLQSKLDSVLFIAYAYNGGIGFTNRMLARQDMFKNDKFEPFLSMELVPYEESRIYGKKVLANYIVYQHLLNGNIRISDIFDSLIQNKEASLSKF